MSHENVEIVRAVLGAWNRYDQTPALPYLDPEVAFDATRRDADSIQRPTSG
jgi:hypothetical protein